MKDIINNVLILKRKRLLCAGHNNIVGNMECRAIVCSLTRYLLLHCRNIRSESAVEFRFTFGFTSPRPFILAGYFRTRILGYRYFYLRNSEIFPVPLLFSQTK